MDLLQSKKVLQLRKSYNMFIIHFLLLLLSTVQAHRETKLLLPLYVYPEDGAWDSTYAAIKNNPSVTFQVILNVYNGPGSDKPGDFSKQSQDWISAVSKLHKFPNIETLGYVHLSYTERPSIEIASDITSWASWNAYVDADIHVDGIFFDEVPNQEARAGAGDVEYMANWTYFAREQFRSSCAAHGPARTFRTMYNPGTRIYHDDYFDLADLVVVWEDYAANYTAEVLRNVPKHRSSRAGILLHDFSSADLPAVEVEQLLTSFVRAGLGTTNIVDYGYENLDRTDAPSDTQRVAEILSKLQRL